MNLEFLTSYFSVQFFAKPNRLLFISDLYQWNNLNLELDVPASCLCEREGIWEHRGHWGKLLIISSLGLNCQGGCAAWDFRGSSKEEKNWSKIRGKQNHQGRKSLLRCIPEDTSAATSGHGVGGHHRKNKRTQADFYVLEQ